MEEMNAAQEGLSLRVMREILDTPALKEVLLLHMKGIEPEKARGLAKTLLWEDPAISMSVLGSLPDAANWILTLLAELGEQLERIPPPLMREIFANMVSRVERGKLEGAASCWTRVMRNLAGAGMAEKGEAPPSLRLLNAAIARLEQATRRMEEDPERAARALAGLLAQLDKAALRRSLRRLARTALKAGRMERPAESRLRFPGVGREGEKEAFAGPWSRRRLMYAWNAFFCLSLGPLMMLMPGLLRRFLRWPGDDPVMTAIYGSIVSAVGVLSVTALVDEAKQERFIALFHVQLLYKAMTCLMLRRELRRREGEKLGLRLFYWFFLLYIALLAGALTEARPGKEPEDEARREVRSI